MKNNAHWLRFHKWETIPVCSSKCKRHSFLRKYSYLPAYLPAFTRTQLFRSLTLLVSYPHSSLFLLPQWIGTIRGLIFSLKSAYPPIFMHIFFVLSFIKIEALSLFYQRKKPKSVFSCVSSFQVFFAKNTLDISKYVKFEYSRAGSPLSFLCPLPKWHDGPMVNDFYVSINCLEPSMSSRLV